MITGRFSQPCGRCGGPKPPGQGRQFCDECHGADQELATLWHAGVPGDEIAATLGISRRAVLDRVNRMRNSGWDLERRRGGRKLTSEIRSRGARVQYARTGRFGLPIGDPAHPLTGAVTCGAYPMEEGEGMAVTCEFPLSEDRSTASLSVTDPERSDGSVLVLAEGCTVTTPERGGSLVTVPDSAVAERSLSSNPTVDRAESARIAASPSPCSKCGGLKPPGQGRRLCDACNATRVVRKRDGRPPKPCLKCGECVPKPRGHKFCAECWEVENEARIARKQARLVVKRKPCPGCGGRKGPGRARYCVQCARTRQERLCLKCGEQPARGRSKWLCVSCAIRAEDRDRERKAEWARAVLATEEGRRQHREAVAASYARTRKRRATQQRKQERERHVGRIPARPLAVAVARWERQTGEIRTRTAEALGVSTHQILRWETGEIQSVNFHTADLAMVHMDLLWWEIWEEGGEGYAEAQNAFEGVV